MKKTISILSGLAIGVVGSTAAFAGGGGSPTKPTVSAEKVRITFTSDIQVGATLPVPAIRFLESIQITPAADETNVTHYNVYWGDTERNKLGIDLAPLLAQFEAKGDGKVISYDFPPEFKMEIGAKWVLVCTENDGVEFCGKDNNMELVFDDLLGTSAMASVLTDATAANSEETCPGLEVMATCGDLTCNGIETASSCPSDCSDYAVTSFNYQNYCDEVQTVYHPTSIAELQAIIAEANTNNQHVKVTAAAAIGGTTGSATGVVCTDGILVITDKLNPSNSNFSIQLENFEGVEVVNAPAGTSMHDLGEWLYQNGKQMGYVHLGWRDATIAGAIGTSAHGSSPKNTNVVANKVVAMDIINPQGELKTYSRGTTGVTNPDLWKAMLTHLGYFGIITGVRVEVEPAQNVHVKVTFHEEDELFNDPNKVVFDDIKDCDYGQYNWFPTLGQYVRWCGNTTTQAGEAGANNTLLTPYGANGESPFQPAITDILQGYQVGSCFPETDVTKTAGALRAAGFHMTPPLLKQRNGNQVYSSDAIGPLHRMTSSHFDVNYPVFQMDWEVAVPQKHMQAALNLVNDFAHGINEKNREMPMPLVGVFVRFSQVEDKTLLSYTGAGGDFVAGTTAVHLEMPIYVPVNMDEARFQEYISAYETINHRLITEFGGRGHWGKNEYYFNGENKPTLFELQRDIGTYGDKLTRFNNAIADFDPKGMFANRQAKAIGVVYPEFTYPANW
jgi:FAD/FMN-containing dehydrogenase